jgi:TRAP-type C4-dicarboxylate transport system substrate-binding protein
MSPSLSVVADNDLKTIITPKAETVSERVRRLQAEARQLAKDHIKSLSAAMVDLEQLAAEIAEGGDAYAPGIREVARQLVDDLESRVQTLEAIASRT